MGHRDCGGGGGYYLLASGGSEPGQWQLVILNLVISKTSFEVFQKNGSALSFVHSFFFLFSCFSSHSFFLSFLFHCEWRTFFSCLLVIIAFKLPLFLNKFICSSFYSRLAPLYTLIHILVYDT